MFEAVKVALSASDTVSDTLDSIQDSAGSVSREFTKTAAASTNFAEGIDITESELEDMQDVLRQLPADANVSARSLAHLQNVADDLGDESADVTMNLWKALEVLEELDDEAIQSNVFLREMSDALEGVGDELSETAVVAHAAAEGFNDVSQSEVVASLQTTVLEQRLNSLRNELLASSGAAATFDEALEGIKPGSIGARFGPIAGSLRTIVIVASTLLPMIAALSSAFLGLAAAGTAVTGGIAGLFAGGLISRAEKMAAASEELEDTGQAIQKIFEQVGAAMRDAIAPLKTLQTENFALGALRSLVTLTGMAADSIVRMSDTLIPMAKRMGAVFMNTSPELFRELELLTAQLGDEFEGFMSGLIRDLPKFLTFIREEGKQLIPILGEFGKSLINLSVALTEVGGGMVSVLVPALTIAVDALTGIGRAINRVVLPPLEILGDILNWVAATFDDTLIAVTQLIGGFFIVGGAIAALINAGTVLATTFGLLSSVASILTAWIGTGLTGAILTAGGAIWTALGPVGILIAAVSALIFLFVDMNDIIGGAIALWNNLVGTIQWLINSTLGLADALVDMFGPLLLLIPGVGQLMWVLGHLDEITRAVTETIQWLGQVADDIFSWIASVVDDLKQALADIVDLAITLAEEIPGIDIDKIGDVEKRVDLSGAKFDEGPDPVGRGGRTKQEIDKSTNVEIGSIDASGSDSSESRIRRIIREEVEKAKDSEVRREDGYAI